jgi:uracil-DNA glycosylase
VATEDESEALRNDVFGCEACGAKDYGFGRIEGTTAFSKFPPTIGAQGNVPLLFVGMNPRISQSNLDLYGTIMRDADAFGALAFDRWKGMPYLRSERHYKLHLEVARRLFPDSGFSSVAAVTELFFCATENSKRLPLTGSSECADRFLDRVARQVQPKVVVAIGSPVRRYFERRRVSGTAVCFQARLGDKMVSVVQVPHPAGFGPKTEYLDRAVEAARSVLAG